MAGSRPWPGLPASRMGFTAPKQRYFRDVSAGPIRRRIVPESVMGTLALVLSFPAMFGALLLWATHGHTSDADNEDLGVVGKDH